MALLKLLWVIFLRIVHVDRRHLLGGYSHKTFTQMHTLLVLEREISIGRESIAIIIMIIIRRKKSHCTTRTQPPRRREKKNINNKNYMNTLYSLNAIKNVNII